VILKIVLKASQEYCIHWRKSTNEREGKPEQKFNAAFGTILTIKSVFKEASGNVVFIYFLNNAYKKFENHLRINRKY
jgi:hypothetical protein